MVMKALEKVSKNYYYIIRGDIFMAELKTTDYKRFRDGFKSQYPSLLAEKENELQCIEARRIEIYEKICYKWIEYDMVSDLYGVDSPEEDELSDEISILIEKYDAGEEQVKINELKKQIAWLKTKIQ